MQCSYAVVCNGSYCVNLEQCHTNRISALKIKPIQKFC